MISWFVCALIYVWTKLLNSVIFTAGRLLAAVEILVSAYGVNDWSSTSHLSAPNTEKTERMKEKERGGANDRFWTNGLLHRLPSLFQAHTSFDTRKGNNAPPLRKKYSFEKLQKMRSGPFSALLFVLVLTLAEGQDQLEGEKVARFKKVYRVGSQTLTVSLHQFHLQLIIAG